MSTVLGNSHPRLAAARALLTPKGRREQGRFLFEGPTLLAEARESMLDVGEVFFSRAAADAHPELRALGGIEAFEVSAEAIARISDVKTPTGIVAVARVRYVPLNDLVLGSAPLLLLAGVGDPGNLGTLLRSADAFGVTGVVVGSGSADPYQPKVVRSAMGALFRITLSRAGPGELAAAARASGRPCIATGTSGEPLPGFRFPERAIIAIGAERAGLADWSLPWQCCVSIPQFGASDSLNAGVAGSIILYELARQKA